ncbi:hypothetical protein BJ878DRAFT_481358 [Calycina marina]|uniref:Major facilitator superfamily (MFS) profile domain-containing protein n=1 Tax=Calycina marina TaxID=1763456 RepID=A0A9P7Z0G6_9HELO|nr:hypothetical protein BJ878DRAFT_481358 [Calycina marina]
MVNKSEVAAETGEKFQYGDSFNLASATALQKPSLWTRRMFQLYGCLLIAILNAAVNGYDGSVMSSINSYTQYREYFNFSLTAGTPSTALQLEILSDHFLPDPAVTGKVVDGACFFGAAVIIIGTIVQATSQNLAAFMIGRFMLGVGAALGPSAALPYVSEMAHPSFRGSMTGVYTTFYWIGAITGTWGLQSTRWLMANDRHEEALQVMAKYHGEGDQNSPLVQLEFHEMLQEISKTGADKRWWDFRELFNTREVCYRTMLVVSIAIFGQGFGNGAVSYYCPQMLAGAGMQSLISLAGSWIGAAYVDKWGRRPVLLVSTSIIVLLFAIVTALNATNLQTLDGTLTAKSTVQANAQIAMVFLFSFVAAVGWTPMQGLYAVEALRYESRSKGMAVYTLWTKITGFYNTFVTSIAFTGVEWKYYFLFIFWDTFTLIYIYFLYVETKNRTLEEMTEIFTAPNPVKFSLQKKNAFPEIFDANDDENDGAALPAETKM